MERDVSHEDTVSCSRNDAMNWAWMSRGSRSSCLQSCLDIADAKARSHARALAGWSYEEMDVSLGVM